MKHVTSDSIKPFDFGGLRITDFGPGGTEAASVAVVAVPRGGRHPKARSTKSDKYYFCLAGPVAFVVEGKKVMLLAGDLLMISKGEWFSYANTTGKKARLFLVHVPPFDLDAEELKEA